VKLRILAEPGELVARGDELLDVVQRLIKRDGDDLRKSAPSKGPQVEFEVLQAAVDRNRAVVNRVRKKMLADMQKVIG